MPFFLCYVCACKVVHRFTLSKQHISVTVALHEDPNKEHASIVVFIHVHVYEPEVLNVKGIHMYWRVTAFKILQRAVLDYSLSVYLSDCTP